MHHFKLLKERLIKKQHWILNLNTLLDEDKRWFKSKWLHTRCKFLTLFLAGQGLLSLKNWNEQTRKRERFWVLDWNNNYTEILLFRLAMHNEQQVIQCKLLNMVVLPVSAFLWFQRIGKSHYGHHTSYVFVSPAKM